MYLQGSVAPLVADLLKFSGSLDRSNPLLPQPSGAPSPTELDHSASFVRHCPSINSHPSSGCRWLDSSRTLHPLGWSGVVEMHPKVAESASVRLRARLAVLELSELLERVHGDAGRSASSSASSSSLALRSTAASFARRRLLSRSGSSGIQSSTKRPQPKLGSVHEIQDHEGVQRSRLSARGGTCPES